jgi:tRNA nucleotidyltransferase/poly(A) polymerase
MSLWSLMSTEGADSQLSSGELSIALAVQSAVEVGADRGESVFVVGGVVRDLLCGRAVGDQDLDIVVQGDGIAFAKALAERVGGVVTTHPAFLTAKLQSPFSATNVGSAAHVPLLSEVDVVTARSEQYPAPGALPVVAAAPIEQDLLRRDFSMNAMALPLGAYQKLLAGESKLTQVESAVVDPCRGKSDLHNKTLRILHQQSFFDDPTRLFRCLRYSLRMGFSMDEETRVAFDRSVAQSAVGTLSTRRVWNELMVAAHEKDGAAIVLAFQQKGLLMSHHLLPASQQETTLQGLTRLAELQMSFHGPVVQDTAALLFVVALQRVSATEVLQAAQIPKSVQRRARAVQELLDGGAAVDPSADVLCAAFALSGRTDLGLKLQVLACQEQKV